MPLTLVLGATTSYNLAFLASFVLGGFLTYLFLLSVTHHRAAAFIGGLVFIFAPNRMGHAAAGHLLLINTWSLPLYALSLVYLFKKPSYRWAITGGLALVALTLTQPIHLAYFALPFSLIYVIYIATQKQQYPRLKAAIPYLGTMVLGSGLILLPFFFPLLQEALHSQNQVFTYTGIEEHSTDLWAFFLPSPNHPLILNGAEFLSWPSRVINSQRQLEEGLAYLGILPVILAIWGIIRQRAKTYVWLSLMIISALLAMGPILHVGGNATNISLPYRWLMDLPFISWSRTPGRLNETTSLALAVLVGLGTADFLILLQNKGQFWWKLAGGVIAGIIFFEYLIIYPFPVGGQKIPVFYKQLQTSAFNGSIIDMPVTGSRRASNFSLVYQTIHNQPIAGGYIERDPPGTVEWAQFFDRLLSPPASDVIKNTPSPAIRQKILYQLGIKQVVVRRWLMTDSAAKASFNFIPEILGQPYYADDDTIAWQVLPVTDDLPPFTVLVDEKGWEGRNDLGVIRLREKGLLFIYTAQPLNSTLTLQLADSTQRLDQHIFINDTYYDKLTQGQVDLEILLQLKAGLNWVSFQVKNCNDCQVDFNRIALE